MTQLLTPKQVASAIQVSESSVKRWCDNGLIEVRKTAGGHRRIPIGAVVEFVRRGEHRLLCPEILGLPTLSTSESRAAADGLPAFVELLLRGDEQAVRQVVLGRYLAGQSVRQICDGLLAPSLRQIGSRWEHGLAEVYQERLACAVVERSLNELNTLLRLPGDDAPRALGATPEGDRFSLPTLMVELVLREAGWQATSLGSSLPFSTLLAAVEENLPAMFWLSVSHVEDPPRMLREYADFQRSCPRAMRLLLGGRALTPGLRRQMPHDIYCQDLAELEALVRTVRQAG